MFLIDLRYISHESLYISSTLNISKQHTYLKFILQRHIFALKTSTATRIFKIFQSGDSKFHKGFQNFKFTFKKVVTLSKFRNEVVEFKAVFRLLESLRIRFSSLLAPGGVSKKKSKEYISCSCFWQECLYFIHRSGSQANVCSVEI